MVRISDGDKRADRGCRRTVAASPVAWQFSLGTKTSAVKGSRLPLLGNRPSKFKCSSWGRGVGLVSSPVTHFAAFESISAANLLCDLHTTIHNAISSPRPV